MIHICQFTALRSLHLGYNLIRSITGLEKVVALRELHLQSNCIEIVSGLFGLKELRSLSLSFNQIVTLDDSLKGLRHLEALQLEGNKLASPVLGLPLTLSELELGGNALTNLKGIEGLSRLTELRAANNLLCKVVGLSKCRALVEVDLSRNKIENLAGLKGLESLQVGALAEGVKWVGWDDVRTSKGSSMLR